MMNRKGSREGDQKTLVSVGLFPDPLDFHSLRESLSFKLPEAILDYLTEINGLVLSIVADFETKKSTLSSKSLHPILGKLQKVRLTRYYSTSFLIFLLSTIFFLKNTYSLGLHYFGLFSRKKQSCKVTFT